MSEDVETLLLSTLHSRGIARDWHKRDAPFDELKVECVSLRMNQQFQKSLSDYLASNPIILQSLETVLAQLAFSAGVRWEQTSEILQPLARRGWHISRWLPTFLLISGPLGRLLTHKSSPLAQALKTNPASMPRLASVRDTFNNDFYRRVRNGFAHWSFTWSENKGSVIINIVDEETGTEVAKLSLLEAEALHYFSARSIQTVDEVLLRPTMLGAR